jgi:hypothetical protein
MSSSSLARRRSAVCDCSSGWRKRLRRLATGKNATLQQQRNVAGADACDLQCCTARHAAPSLRPASTAADGRRRPSADNSAKQKPTSGGTVMRGQQTRPECLLRSSSSDRPAVRRSGDKPASESPAATRQQVVRFRRFVAPRRRPPDQPGPFELQQRPERVRPVGHQLRFMAMGQRNN